MSRKLTLFLVAINLALAAGLAWQWLSPAGQRSTHWAAPAPLAPQLGAGSAGMQLGQESDAARVAALLERPVFAVTRRPLPPPKVAAAAPVAPPPDPLDSVHIFGMFSGSEGGGLIVRAEGKTRRLKVSESFGEWRLREIRGTDAVFARAGETRVISLVQVKQGAGAAAVAPPVRPAMAAPAPTSLSAPAPSPASQRAAQAPPAPGAPGSPQPPPAALSPFVIGGSR